MEASALQAPAGLRRTRISVGAPLLRLRTDEQLVALFRSGHDDAFRVIHDRYRQRLFAYARQMLPGSRQDAEDALQDVFVRAYSALRASDKQLALRPWLYRIAHNRCIDELRRPVGAAPEVMELLSSSHGDPIAEAERRESLRRLIADLRRLPEQQRSALLMRELSGMTYEELVEALGVSLAAVKSLLVRARVGLVQAADARDIACSQIREQLIDAHDRGVRPSGVARRHMRDCDGCRTFRGAVKGSSRQLAGLVPALGPLGFAAKALGIGGSAAAGGGAAAGSGGGAVAAGGALTASTSHVATLLAAVVVTAGGALEVQRTLSGPADHQARHGAVRSPALAHPAQQSQAVTAPQAAPPATQSSQAPTSVTGASATSGTPSSGSLSSSAGGQQTAAGSSSSSRGGAQRKAPVIGLNGGGLDPGSGSLAGAGSGSGNPSSGLNGPGDPTGSSPPGSSQPAGGSGGVERGGGGTGSGSDPTVVRLSRSPSGAGGP